MTKEEIFLQEYKHNHFSIDFSTGIITSTKLNRQIGSINKNNGYIYITIRHPNTGNNIKIYAHRLIWLCYYGLIDPNLQINHINGIKTDNRLCNLELVIPSENIHHAIRSGLSNPSVNGRKNKEYFKTHDTHRRKFTNSQVIEMRDLYESGCYSLAEIGEKYGVCAETIRRIVKKIYYSNV